MALMRTFGGATIYKPGGSYIMSTEEQLQTMLFSTFNNLGIDWWHYYNIKTNFQATLCKLGLW